MNIFFTNRNINKTKITLEPNRAAENKDLTRGLSLGDP